MRAQLGGAVCERVPRGSADAACMLLLRAKRVSPKGEVTAQGVASWQRCVVAEIHTINPRDFE